MNDTEVLQLIYSNLKEINEGKRVFNRDLKKRVIVTKDRRKKARIRNGQR